MNRECDCCATTWVRLAEGLSVSVQEAPGHSETVGDIWQPGSKLDGEKDVIDVSRVSIHKSMG